MHETRLIRRLIQTAMQEATQRGGKLSAIYVRLGALAGGSPAHLHEHFVIEAQAMGLGDLGLHIIEESDRPTGVEITGIEISEES